MKIETMKDAFVHELSDIHSAEKQLTKALPKMAEAASDEELKNAFTAHLKETEDQMAKVEQAAKLCKVKIKRKKCMAMAGLTEEGAEIIREIEEGAVRDAMLIIAGQKVEHYEMASYGSLVAVAKQLGFMEAAGIFEEILQEEKQTDEKLNELALRGINDEAAEQENTKQKGNQTMNNRNNYSDNRGRNMPERDEEGRFMSSDDNGRSGGRSSGNLGRSQSRYEEDDDNDSYQSGSNRGRNQYSDDRDYNDNNRYSSGRGRSSNYSNRDDRYYDDNRSGGGRSQGRGQGWFGDSEGRSEASSRGWQNSDHEGSGWYGDSEGHAEAGRQSHGGRSSNYSSRDDRYDDNRSNGGRSYSSSSRDDRYYDDNRGGRSQGRGQGWFGDSEGHAEAGRHSHDNDRNRSYGGRR